MSYNITSITCYTYIIVEIHPDDKKGLVGNRSYVASMLLGLAKSSYSLSVDLAQAQEGIIMALDSCSYKYANAVVNSFGLGSFEQYYALDLALWPITACTLCLVELSAFQDYIANVTGDLGTRAREILEAYHHHLLVYLKNSN